MYKDELNTYYNLCWFILKDRNINDVVTALGFCEYCKKIAKIAPNDRKTIHPFFRSIIMNDIIVEEKENYCEESESCLELECKLNNTTLDTFNKAYKLNKKEWKKLLNTMKFFNKILRYDEESKLSIVTMNFIKKRKFISINLKKILFEKPYCNICGSADNLQIHHLLPISMFGDNNIKNLVLVCRNCHLTKFHNKILHN